MRLFSLRDRPFPSERRAFEKEGRKVRLHDQGARGHHVKEAINTMR